MAGTAPIITMGFGSWGGVELLPTLGFNVGEASVVIVHYHVLSGPSKYLHQLQAASTQVYVLAGCE